MYVAFLLLFAAGLLANQSNAALPSDTLASMGARKLSSQCAEATIPALQPTSTHSPVVDLKWLGKSDQVVVAMTKKIGAEIGGLWMSYNAGQDWTENTVGLATCPPDFPHLCSKTQLCYTDAALAQQCASPESAAHKWCALPNTPHASAIPQYGGLCPTGCPMDRYPHLCALLQVCYNDKRYAADCIGPPGSWCGLPWNHVQNQIPKYGELCFPNITRKVREPVEVMGVLSKKSDAAKIVIFGTGTYIWSSPDYGKKIYSSRTPTMWRGIGIKDMKHHPWHEDWLLLLVKRPGCTVADRAQTECPHDLMLTQDLFTDVVRGPTWTNLTEKSGGRIAAFVDFDWGASLCRNASREDMLKAGECAGMRIEDNTIMATMYRVPGAYDQAWDADVHFTMSHDFYHSYDIKVYCGNMFEVIGSKIYLAYANSCPTDINGWSRSGGGTFKGITMFTSADGGASFTQGCLPVAIKQEGYEIMSTHDQTGAIVIVDFIAPGNVPASSVYTAGPHHAVFSLSLTNVYKADFGYSSDFARIEGLPGVYIANRMAPRSESDDYNYGPGSTTTRQLVETHISFNGGGKWSRIPAPKSFRSQKCNRCPDTAATSCYLHLRGSSTWESMTTSMPAVYSSPSAPGMIMATGVVAMNGMGLEDDLDGTCTWLSTDGGVTWSDVGEGSYIYEYADWGSTIVMARHPGLRGKAATEIKFSVDFGSCWYSVPLATAMFVDNIRIEPDGQQPVVIVHGQACEKDVDPKCTLERNRTNAVVPGLIYKVDVQSIVTTNVFPGRFGKCSPLADMEEFYVPKGTSDATPACILGRVMKIQRRGADKRCFYGADYQRPLPTNSSCGACTMADLECDYGFLRIGDKCLSIKRESMPICPRIDAHEYYVSATGLRLVHGDVCSPLDTIISDTDGKGKCLRNCHWAPPSGGGSQHGPVFKAFMTLLALAIISGAFLAWWSFLASEVHKDWIRDAASLLASVVVNLYNSVMDRVRGRPSDLHEHDMGYFQPLGEVPDREAGIFTLK